MIPGQAVLGRNVATGTIHALVWDVYDWRPVCATNALRRPVKGRQRARSEFAPLTDAEAAALPDSLVPCERCCDEPEGQEAFARRYVLPKGTEIRSYVRRKLVHVFKYEG
jgi:hypothetical protein